jgi:hypothetical protein
MPSKEPEMRQELGWSAAVAVALAAAIGVSSRISARPPADTGRSARPPGQSTTKPATPADQFAQGPCVDIEEHLQAFLVDGDKDSIAAPPSCFGQSGPIGNGSGEKLRKSAQKLRLVIATLPDPLHTHFPLSFDRLIEAIQQGATDEGYTYDSSWLPWETQENQFALIQDQDKEDDRKEAREDQPGILLFRRSPGKGETDALQPYKDGLLVFIVGEEPTQGIHRIQFQNAAAWMAALKPESVSGSSVYEFPTQILGPSFSGSLPSLASALMDLKEKSNIQAKPDISIYSGNITSGTLVKWFAGATSVEMTPHLLSFRQSDEKALGFYCNFLKHSGFDLKRLAVISEDETAYGNEFRDKDESENHEPDLCGVADGPARLSYPRDISALRTAYQKQSIFNQPAGEPALDSSRRTLNSDIADPEGQEHDTIRNYNSDQTAMSQEAVLQQIVSQLRVHQSEYVVLRSSNPLDLLFLSHYLRLTYPQGRIVTLGADLLLRRESGAARLSGIMTLSTYPQLPWEQHWTRAKGDANSHAHRVFSQDDAEGTYVAARYLLHPTPPFLGSNGVEKHGVPEYRFLPVTTDPRFRIPDYATPFWIRKDAIEPPPIWLSVLGRNDFWPVAALNEGSIPMDPGKRNLSIGDFVGRFFYALRGAARSLGRMLLAPVFGKTAFGDQWQPWPDMPISMRIALAMVFVWAIFHLACCSHPSVMDKPSHRAYFVCFDGGRGTHHALLIIGSIALSSTGTVLGWGYGAMSPDGAPVATAWIWLSMVPLLWFISGISLTSNIWRQHGVRRNETGDNAAKATRKNHQLVKTLQRVERATVKSFKDFPHSFRRKWPFLWCPLLAYAAGVVGFYFLLYFCTENVLVAANRIPTYWRDMNLTSGVSPLIPLLAPAVGLYMWFWFSLQGLSFFGPDHPLLPSEDSLEIEFAGKKKWLRMFSQKYAAEPIEAQCRPFAGEALRVGIPLLVILIPLAFFIADGPPIRSLGARPYSILICILMDICVSAMLANAWRLLKVWMGLRQLLTFLYRLRLRRSMAAFPGVSWGSVWKISGNVLEMRYKLLTRQAECATHLKNSLDALQLDSTFPRAELNSFLEVSLALKDLQGARKSFAEWYSDKWDKPDARDLKKLRAFQICLAKTAGVVITRVLLPAWGNEAGPQPEGDTPGDEKGHRISEGTCLIPVARLEPHIRYAEQLVCYVYLGFIQNILGRMRSIAMSILWLFIAATVAMASYPFDPRPTVSGAMALLFAVLGAVIAFVYAQMHRDPILSLVTNTTPGELGGEFWLKLAAFGAGPALGLLATMFPELTDVLFTWVQPGISSAR